MTTALKLPKDQVSGLRIRDVQLYLTSRGWVPDSAASTPKATVYRYLSEPDAEVLLPTRRELVDYTLRMADIVTTLAAVEQRSVWEVLNDLSGPPSDVLRLRVAASEAVLGNLPLEEGIELLRGGRDLLSAAACSTIRPQAFHPQKTLKEADKFIKGCRLGQTERGSFVATIIAPVPPSIPPALPFSEGDLVEDTEPFARRVTTRLMTSLNIVDDTVRTGKLDPILKGVPEGVSANLCEALLAMKPPGAQDRLDLRMDWARTRPEVPAGVPQKVSFTQDAFPIIEEAGRRLRVRAKPKRERFEGKIIGLQTEIRSLFPEITGKVVLRTQVGGQTARVKVVLNREDYRKACDAHRDEQRVAITGVIHHDIKIRLYELSEPREFQILPDTDPVGLTSRTS